MAYLLDVNKTVIQLKLNERVHDFSVDYDTFDISDIINVHKYLLRKHDMK